MVADALSRRGYCNILSVQEQQPRLYEELKYLNLEIVEQGYVNTLEVHPTVLDQIKGQQERDEDIQEIKRNMRRG